MIQLGLYTLILPKHLAESRLNRSVQLEELLPQHKIEQDEYLYAIKGKYVTHMATATELLIKSGVRFDESNNRSDDFTVMAKEGLWWKVEWLILQGDQAWFIADVEAPV